MKITKVLLFTNMIVIFLFCNVIYGQPMTQIPNGDFELWATCLCDPPDWITNNIYDPFTFILVGMGEAYAGSFGISGKVDSSTQFNSIEAPSITSVEIQMVSRPDALIGYYKFYPNQADVFKAHISLYKNAALIGEGNFADSNTVPEYRKFNVEINYTNNDTPDTAFINFTIDKSNIDNKLHLGSEMIIDELSFTGNSSVTRGISSSPDRFSLFQNYPNPFTHKTAIGYNLPRSENVVVTIYNVLGEKIKTIENQKKSTGSYTSFWDGRNESGEKLPGGIYFYELKTGVYVSIKKAVKIK